MEGHFGGDALAMDRYFSEEILPVTVTTVKSKRTEWKRFTNNGFSWNVGRVRCGFDDERLWRGGQRPGRWQLNFWPGG